NLHVQPLEGCWLRQGHDMAINLSGQHPIVRADAKLDGEDKEEERIADHVEVR
ncbi:hypothetical protein GUITHDRAFT_153180, partial [Guillardia theta CCMP2712]